MKLHRYARILRLIDVIGDCLDVKVPDEGARPIMSPRIRNIFRHTELFSCHVDEASSAYVYLL